MANSGALSVDGVDISEKHINFAKSAYGNTPKINFSTGDITSCLINKTYDIIVCFETIEHIYDYNLALSNLYKLLNNNGFLIISSPNRIITSPNSKTLNDKPNNKFHIHEFTIKEMKNILETNGFKISDSNIFGQRKQFYFKNKILQKIYRKLLKPEFFSSPRVSKIKNLEPRYFILKAQKNNS